jgi:hypothetical protein
LAVSGDKENAALLQELKAPVIQLGVMPEYLPMPWKCLHKFGGMAHVLHPGKIAMIAAPSGYGKTSLLETWVDAWLQMGYDLLWYGPEWSQREYSIRRIQRHGGLTINDYALHQIWKTELALCGKSDNGVQLSETLRTKSIAELQKIKAWRGHIYYLPSAPNVETTQEQINQAVHFLRRKGRRIGGVVWDYLQLLRSENKEDAGNRHETTLDSIKHFAETSQLVNIVGSQVNKDVAKTLERQTSFRLTASDLHYAREDKVNLLLGIEPQFGKQKKSEHAGDADFYTDPDEPVFLGWARLRILKNSIGERAVGGMGYMVMTANFKYLSWLPK